jgi:hypothetical protein
MRHRFVNVLESDEKDPTTEVALRGFWARATPCRVAPRLQDRGGHEARVIDLAGWAHRYAKPPSDSK